MLTLMFILFLYPQNGSIRLSFGQHGTSYTDHQGNFWWGQNVPRPFNSTYEIGDGIGFAYLNGTWSGHASSWSETTDAQLYAQSLSANNDINLTLVVPNGTYALTLYGEPDTASPQRARTSTMWK